MASCTLVLNWFVGTGPKIVSKNSKLIYSVSRLIWKKFGVMWVESQHSPKSYLRYLRSVTINGDNEQWKYLAFAPLEWCPSQLLSSWSGALLFRWVTGRESVELFRGFYLQKVADESAVVWCGSRTDVKTFQADFEIWPRFKINRRRCPERRSY